jgi:hypothetical protein
LPVSTTVSEPAPPCTPAEWRKIIAEVKRKYFSKGYRACSARCLEVLDGIKDASQVEPVYLIYLHFYAATSMEICARPLPPTSALRANLLQQARTHFNQAASLINSAEESVLRKFRPGSVSSSRGSSCHSPSGSISSRAWTPDTRLSSPTNSVCSFDDLTAKRPLSPSRRVKKVSFSLPKEQSLQPVAAEPVIRPDSPTLGFDDAFFPAAAPATQQALPDKPAPSPKFQEIELPLQPIPEHEDESESGPRAAVNGPEEQDDQNAYLAARAVHRYCEHLSSLRAQLARHSTSLDQLLSSSASASSGPNGPSPSEPASMSPSLMTTTITANENAKPSSSNHGAGRASAPDLRARIERLRSIGWQRKRFDPARYEALCDAVMAELA